MSKDVESGKISGEAEVQDDLEQFSTGKGDTQASQEEVVLDERLVKRMQEEVDKRFQSAKTGGGHSLRNSMGSWASFRNRQRLCFQNQPTSGVAL